MYRRPKFLEKLIDIRTEMAAEADFDVDLFAEIARSGNRNSIRKPRPSERLDQNVKPSDADLLSLLKIGDA